MPPEKDDNKAKRIDDIPVWDQEFLKADQDGKLLRRPRFP